MGIVQDIANKSDNSFVISIEMTTFALVSKMLAKGCCGCCHG